MPLLLLLRRRRRMSVKVTGDALIN